MENIDFVLWTCLWPITSSLSNYLGAKQRKIEGEEPLSEEVRSKSSMVTVVIWAIGMLILYQR